jgi:hypothetical protein
MSPLRRRGTAQAGYPEDRGVWLTVAVAFTLLVAWLVINRGPYGGPITTGGAVLRTLVLLVLASLPIAALLWAWRRLSRKAQRIAPIPIGVLVAFLGLYAVAHAGIYAERVRMGSDPARLAAAAAGAGKTEFLAVSDSLNAVHVPPVANRCIINKYGFRTIPGTDGMTVNPKHARYRQAAAQRAQAYNNVLIQRLRIPTAEASRFSDGSGCAD